MSGVDDTYFLLASLAVADADERSLRIAQATDIILWCVIFVLCVFVYVVVCVCVCVRYMYTCLSSPSICTFTP